MTLPDILFYAFSAVLVLSALAVISARNPVYSVLFLILAFFNAAGLLVLLGAEFLAMILVVVYVGAVAVLFLFVVMMLNINITRLKEGFLKYLPIGLLVAAVLFFELFGVLYASDLPGMKGGLSAVAATTSGRGTAHSNTMMLGLVLYTHYAYLFQLAGVILLVAMIGAIVLTHRQREGVKRQSIYNQVARNPRESVTLVNVESGKGIV